MFTKLCKFYANVNARTPKKSTQQFLSVLSTIFLKVILFLKKEKLCVSSHFGFLFCFKPTYFASHDFDE